ncbi:hypothetical protein M9Y10_020484 [Tritrichomonas musculus]|uniref:Surface antigen BspA-like n=1 Tax=Tritrichomonas musculus TaxID=1915356 RepID=A0ABR2HGA2_9EUKA
MTPLLIAIFKGNNEVVNALLKKNGIVEAAFEYSELTKIVIPSFIKKVGNYAFFNCTKLTEVIFEGPSLLEEIGIGAFSGCASLKIILIPESVKVINKYAFSECYALESAIFQSPDIELRLHAFRHCPLLHILAKDKVRFDDYYYE